MYLLFGLIWDCVQRFDNNMISACCLGTWVSVCEAVGTCRISPHTFFSRWSPPPPLYLLSRFPATPLSLRPFHGITCTSFPSAFISALFWSSLPSLFPPTSAYGHLLNPPEQFATSQALSPLPSLCWGWPWFYCSGSCSMSWPQSNLHVSLC